MEAVHFLAQLEAHATSGPHRPAIVLGHKGAWHQLSYRDLLDETHRWAAFWAGIGCGQGAVVLIVLQHCLEMYPAFLGAMWAGLVPALLPFPTPKQDPVLYWRGHKELFARVKPAAILTYTTLVAPISTMTDATTCTVFDLAQVTLNTPEPPPPLATTHLDQLALLQHSSGTTGLKKGVTLTYRQIAHDLAACASAIELMPQDRIITWLPIYHDMGLVATFLLPLYAGAMFISMDAFEWLKQPDMFLIEIARFGATICWLPNFAFNHLVRTRDRDRIYDLASMRLFINCSEPCKPETVALFRETFAPFGLRKTAVQASYGMAEVVFCATQTGLWQPPRELSIDCTALSDRSEAAIVAPSHKQALHFLSCGSALRGVEIRIVPRAPGPERAGLKRLAADMGINFLRRPHVPVGEVQIRCQWLFEGYFRNPAGTEAAFDGDWFKSGDIGFLYEGELYICGRIKEMLIVHGRNFYANDIEAIVNRVEGVKPGRVVAVGVYQPSTASEEAVVMAETTLTDTGAHARLAADIKAAVLNALNLALWSVEIAPEATLVKTTSGKLSREENVKRLQREDAR